MNAILRINALALLVGGVGILPTTGCGSDADLATNKGEQVQQVSEALMAESQSELAPSNFYYVRAKHSGKCLHQSGATFGNGDPITQWECVDQPNVQWEFVASPDPGSYFIKVRHSGKCAHQLGWTFNNGDPIAQWDCINQDNVKWRLIPASGGYYYIQVQHSGKCLHQSGATFGNGDPITQWDCINQPNVLWALDPVGH